MKTDHKDLKEYLDWLQIQCQKDFDNDKDLLAINFKPSEDIECEKLIIINAIKKVQTKEELLNILLDHVNTSFEFLGHFPNSVFSCAAAICSYCWVRDN